MKEEFILVVSEKTMSMQTSLNNFQYLAKKVPSFSSTNQIKFYCLNKKKEKGINENRFGVTQEMRQCKIKKEIKVIFEPIFIRNLTRTSD